MAEVPQTHANPSDGAGEAAPQPPLYEIQIETLAGEPSDLRAYRGKVLLIVNTASKCGFTPQFAGLEELWRSYRDQGLVVLGFPCNQFGRQDPGSADEIESFCQINYGVSFPMHAKSDVNGERANPLFRYLKREAPGVFGTQAIKWNFTKFLVDRSGRVRARFAPTTPPSQLRAEVERLLAEPQPASAAR
jgi:glutathione peroxidase